MATAPATGVAPTATRVLIVSHGHPDLSAGGGEITSYALFRGLKQMAGCEAHYLAYDEGAPDPAAPEGVASFRGRSDEFVFRAGGFDRFGFGYGSSALAAGFMAFLERLRPDVIHLHHYLNIGLEFIDIARQVNPRVKILLTLHEYYAICHHAGVMMRARAGVSFCAESSPHDCARCFPELSPADFVRRKAGIRSRFDAIDVLIAPSRFLRERYIAWGVPDWQIIVLDNTLETPVAKPEASSGGSRARNRFAYFGQIHPYKGLQCLLAAFERIAGAHDGISPTPQLTIHGAHLELNAPDFVGAIRSALARCGAGVEFQGPYVRSQLAELMARTDWVVLPSIWWENAPLVIEEALACRRPVLCSDIGGMAEKVRPGLDGFHFPVGDAAALAALIVKLSGDARAWNDLQPTLRRPVLAEAAVAAHWDVYRDTNFAFA